jgi:hypothetical protein
MPNVTHIDLYAGEDRTITLNGRDASNNAVSLTGKTVTWYVGRPPLHHDDDRAIFTKTGTVTVAASGTFTVPVVAADTTDLAGDYEHMAKAVTSGTNAVAVIVRGRFRVNPTLSAT